MDLIGDINMKYMALEAEVDKKLEKVKRDEEKYTKLEKNLIDKTASSVALKKFSYKEALARNANLLKSLEMSKARLRSLSTFSPIEQILEKATENYKKDLLKRKTEIPIAEVTTKNPPPNSVGSTEI